MMDEQRHLSVDGQRGFGLVAGTVVVCLQIGAFIFAWKLLVSMAAAAGRVQRGGIGFGIMVHYSVYLFGLMCCVASGVAVFSSSVKVRWIAIGALLVGWGLWCAPILPDYPNRGSVFLALGAIILTIGSGLIAPWLNRKIQR